jgi:hypothetical protein
VPEIKGNRGNWRNRESAIGCLSGVFSRAKEPNIQVEEEHPSVAATRVTAEALLVFQRTGPHQGGASRPVGVGSCSPLQSEAVVSARKISFPTASNET